MKALRARLAKAGLMMRQDILTDDALPKGPLFERIDVVAYLRENDPDALAAWIEQSSPEIAPYIANFDTYAEERSNAYSKDGTLDTADQIILPGFRKCIAKRMRTGSFENAILAGPYGLIDVAMDELSEKGVDFEKWTWFAK